MATRGHQDGYLGLETMGDAPLSEVGTQPTVGAGTEPTQGAEGAGPPQPGAPTAGDVIAARYRLVAAVGQGGMGSVFRAEHVQTGGLVAVKFLHAEAEALRFELEARHAAALSHPNTVRVIDYGVDRGRHYLVMEFLRGVPLTTLVSAGPVAWPRVVRIAAQVLKSLWEAHELGIVHRDIKPANILVTEQAGTPDFVKVVDFGIARVLGTSGAHTRGLLGSPQVMAPEQWNDEPVTAQTDLYALGCTVYQLLTGREPFVAETVAAMAYHHVCTDPQPLANLASDDTPSALIAWVERAMEKLPERRHPSAQHALDALQPLLERPAAAKLASGDAVELPDQPYRHLEPFTRAHAAVFFGRKRKVRQLHAAISDEGGAPIVFLYGPSGVGKSSLLDAGVRPRLEQTHAVVYLRRASKVGLVAQLHALLGAPAGGLGGAWRDRERELDQPLVVLLDQVEELFTQPGPDGPHELARLIEALQAVFALRSERPRGRLVLSFRKEWLADLEAAFDASGLPVARLGVAPLTRPEILEVIQGPTSSAQLRAAYHLELEDGLPERIADLLLADHRSALAPTLQILLTKLWRTAPLVWSTAQDADVRRFTHAHLDALVAEGLFLTDFVDAQVAALEAWRPEVVRSGLLLDLLVQHTTPAGTARDVGGTTLSQAYPHLAATLPELLRRCKDAYLLAGDLHATGEVLAGASRLAHDTLAPLVRQRFEDSDLPGQRAARILQARALDWRDGQVAEPLDAADLALVEQGRDGTRGWTPDDVRLIAASREHRRRSQRRRRALLVAGAAAVLLIAAFGAFAWHQQGVATDAASAAEAAKVAAVASERQTEEVLAVSRTHLLVSRFFDQVGGGKRIATALLAVQAYRRHVARPIGDTTKLYRALREASAPDFMPRVIDAHSAPVTRVTFAGPGDLLSVSVDGTVKRWDLGGPDAPVASATLPSGVTAVATSPAGVVVVGTQEGEVFAFRDGAALRDRVKVGACEGAVAGVAVDAAGRLVLASGGGSARLWDLSAPGAAPREWPVHQSGDVRFAPSGRRVAIGGYPELKLVDLDDPGDPLVLTGHNEPVWFVAYDAAGSLLATAAPDGRILLRAADAPHAYRSLVDETKRLRSFALSGDGRTAVAGYDDFSLQVWDLENVPAARRHLGRGRIDAEALAIDHAGGTVVEGGDDGRLRIWDLRRPGVLARSGRRGVTSMATAPDGTVVLASFWGILEAWSPDRRSHVDLVDTDFEPTPDVPADHLALRAARRLFEALATHQSFDADMLTALFVAPTGAATDAWLQQYNTILSQVAAMYAPITILGAQLKGPDRAVLAIATRAGRLRFSIGAVADAAGQAVVAGFEFKGLSPDQSTVAADPSRRRVATGGAGTVRLYDLEVPERPARRLHGHGDAHQVTALAFTADGARLASGADDGSLLVWSLDAPEDAAALRLDGHPKRITSLAFRPGGRQLASAGSDGAVRIWEPDAGAAAVATVLAHGSSVDALTYTPDGARLVTAGADALVKVRRADAPAEVLHTFAGHTGPVTVLAASRDGRRLASGGKDASVRVWDLDDAAPQVLLGHTSQISGLGFDPEGRPVSVNFGEDGTLVTWPAMADLADGICARAWRNLTRDEWASLIGWGLPYERTCPNLPAPP